MADFRECDFGIFEGKNYEELKENRDYQRWLDSGGVLPFRMERGERPSQAGWRRRLTGLRQNGGEMSRLLRRWSYTAGQLWQSWNALLFRTVIFMPGK